MAAKGKILLLLASAAVAATSHARLTTPYTQALRAPENRIWENFCPSPEPRPAFALQLPEPHRVEFAFGLQLAPEPPIDPDGRLAKGIGGGAVLGDYYKPQNLTQGIGQFVGQVGMGFTPAGVLGDVRDFTAALGELNSNGLGLGTGAGVVLAGVAFVPGVGDAVKGILKPLFGNADTAARAARNFDNWGGEFLDDARVNASGPAYTELELAAKVSSPRTIAEAIEHIRASPDVIVIGRRPDTTEFAKRPGHFVLSVDDWSLAGNRQIISEVAASKRTVLLASDPKLPETFWRRPGEATVTFDEIQQLVTEHGYRQVGNQLVPSD